VRSRNEVALDLQGEIARVDPALREAAGDEPQARLGGAPEHVAQLLVLAESPDRADAFRDRRAEELAHQCFLPLPAGGEHHEIVARQHVLEL